MPDDVLAICISFLPRWGQCQALVVPNYGDQLLFGLLSSSFKILRFLFLFSPSSSSSFFFFFFHITLSPRLSSSPLRFVTTRVLSFPWIQLVRFWCSLQGFSPSSLFNFFFSFSYHLEVVYVKIRGFLGRSPNPLWWERSSDPPDIESMLHAQQLASCFPHIPSLQSLDFSGLRWPMIYFKCWLIRFLLFPLH